VSTLEGFLCPSPKRVKIEILFSKIYHLKKETERIFYQHGPEKYDSSENACDSISNEAFDNASDASTEDATGYPSLTHLTPFLSMPPLTTPLMLRTTSPYTRNANADTTSYIFACLAIKVLSAFKSANGKTNNKYLFLLFPLIAMTFCQALYVY
jgi:hypothetical protein